MRTKTNKQIKVTWCATVENVILLMSMADQEVEQCVRKNRAEDDHNENNF